MLTNRAMLLLQNAEAFEHLAAYRESSLEWTCAEGSVTLRGATVSPTLFFPATDDGPASAGSSRRTRRERARTASRC